MMTAVELRGTAAPKPLVRLVPVYAIVGVSYLGYAMMATLFVPMMLSPTSPYVPEGASMQLRSLLLGVLLMLYPMAQVVGSPVLGALSDRYGRRPVLVASLAVTTIAYGLICIGLATHMLWLLAFALAACGIGEANAAIGTSVVADTTDPDERPKYLGYMWSVVSVSYVLGPVLGGATAARFGYMPPFLAMLAILAATLATVVVFFRETHAPDARAQSQKIAASLGNLLTVFTDKPLRAYYLVNFLVFVASMGFWRVITEYLVDVFDLSVGEVTVDYAALALTAGIGNLVIMPILVGRVDMRRLGMISTTLGALGVLLVLVPAGASVAVAFGALASIALALSFASLSGLLSARVGPERQGAVLGNNTALGFLGEAIGVLGGSMLAGISPELPMVLFALVALLAVIILKTRITPTEAVVDKAVSRHPGDGEA
ncbi:Predicted arabinose efflux permease, MFS family [Kaistia soli DSM 19436]|uniref:Predicted arabinose efflux permease, MFS family n=1 Tax=Kaistia soli DSM 19436 TaxID=1122133 RepID=A0A1M5NUC4_9HYPH|nr:MFS transporter [Kaistia soli]SHG93087.1 Predicted arabinose efflux permease, MFS family [Kaistia soli DSM 19436]